MNISQLCDQILSQVNYIEEHQLKYGENYNYDGWDFVSNPIPEMPRANLFTDKDSDIIVTKNNRFSYVPAHTHEFVEINYVFKGKSQQQLNGQEHNLKAGELLILDHTMVHRIGYSDKDDLTANILLKDNATISRIIESTGHQDTVITNFLRNTTMPGKLGHSNYMIFDLNKNPAAKDIADLIVYKGLTHEKNRIQMQLLVSSLIEELPVCLEANYSDFSLTSKDQTLEEIALYINTHCSSVTLTELSQEFGYNPNYISNLIKKRTGKTFKELVELRRLDMAENLIIKTNLRLDEINQMIGYHDSTSLYRIFKKHLNMTPAVYRDEVRGHSKKDS